MANPLFAAGSRALRNPRVRRAAVMVAPLVQRKAEEQARHLHEWHKAVRHADSLADGSVLRVLVGREAHWVVWQGDTPRAIYPHVNGDLGELTRGSDLSKRRTPDDLLGRTARRRATVRAVKLGQAAAERASRLRRGR